MNEQIERVTLRVPGSVPFREGETPHTLAQRLVAEAVRPDAIEWAVTDVNYYDSRVDGTTTGQRLRHSVMGLAEWQFTYEVVVPAKVDATR